MEEDKKLMMIENTVEVIDITANLQKERIVVYNKKKNQFISVFYHLRNAFAHGRLNMIDIIKAGYRVSMIQVR